jgi:hypothetical protein
MEVKKKTTFDLIKKDLDWLDSRSKSTNIIEISYVLNHLNGLMVTFADEVSVAYELMCQAEDEYDIAFAKKFTELTENGTSAAGAKPKVESELGDLKKKWTEMKVLYKRLNTFLDRCDRVNDSFRQMISIQKQMDLKNV